MKSATRVLIPFALTLALAPLAAAQDDKETQKKKILQEVEKRLEAEHDRLLKDLEKVIEEALAGKKAAPAPAEEPPKALAPAPAKKARGFLGIGADALSEDEKKDLGVKGGVKIMKIVPDGPAAKAGLQVDDVITAVDGHPLESPTEVPALVQAAGAGGKLKIDYLRDGKKQNTSVTLGRHPDDAQDPAPAPKDDPKAGGDLRERIKKFMDKKEPAPAPKAEGSKPGKKAEPGPEDDVLGQLKGLLDKFDPEQFGLDKEQFKELLEQFMPKDEDGNPKLPDLKELLKGMDLERFFGHQPKEEAPKKEEKKPAPKKDVPAPSGPRAWLGLQPEELAEEMRSQFDLEGGLLLADVVAGGPAEKAGLKKNDILVKIDGKVVKGESTLADYMKSAKPGQEATFTILRKAKEQTLKVTLGEKQ